VKIGFVLILFILTAPSSLCLAVEYKTLDNEYFSVEYPEDWKVSDYNGNTISYRFAAPLGSDNYVYDTLFIIKIGINGVASIERYGINQNLKDFFNVDNTFNETVNHFLQSFRAKKTQESERLKVSCSNG